jgi:excisionase family DNA binding protein
LKQLTKDKDNRKIRKKGEAAAMAEDRLLTTKEVADELRRSERWVLVQIQDGKLQAVDLGKGYRVYRSELDRFIRERLTKKDKGD